jgi:hypothetical protein
VFEGCQELEVGRETGGQILIERYNVSDRRNKFERCIAQHGDYS